VPKESLLPVSNIDCGEGVEEQYVNRVLAPSAWSHQIQTSLLAYGFGVITQSCHSQRSHVRAMLFQIYQCHARVICAFFYIPSVLCKIGKQDWS
jgi:hypothetical protein